MTREYHGLIGDGREFVVVTYDIIGEPDDFDIEILKIYCDDVDITGCLLTQQIIEIEMEIIKAVNRALSGLGYV